jgi:hypothetical protein
MKPRSFCGLQTKNGSENLRSTKAGRLVRGKLLDNINADFGTKLDAKDQNWSVSAASALKAYLLNDYKCSDEPWE